MNPVNVPHSRVSKQLKVSLQQPHDDCATAWMRRYMQNLHGVSLLAYLLNNITILFATLSKIQILISVPRFDHTSDPLSIFMEIGWYQGIYGVLDPCSLGMIWCKTQSFLITITSWVLNQIYWYDHPNYLNKIGWYWMKGSSMCILFDLICLNTWTFAPLLDGGDILI